MVVGPTTSASSEDGTFGGEILGLKNILYYKNHSIRAKRSPQASSVLLSPRSMRSIRLVITLLDPRDELQHSFNRIGPQG